MPSHRPVTSVRSTVTALVGPARRLAVRARRSAGQSRPVMWAYSAVKSASSVTSADSAVKSASSGRLAVYALALAILAGGGLALTLGGQPHPAANAATRDGDRASRGEARVAPTTPTTTAPPTTAPPTPAVTTAPAIPSPVATTAAPPAVPVPAPAPVVAAGCSGYSGNRLVACNLLPAFGYSTGEMAALDPMWDRESGWSISAANPSGAYGIPQALPGSKMATAGGDWRTNPATQISWGLGYIKSRYGSPSAAWSYWQNNGWY